jgi:hypothetical protein
MEVIKDYKDGYKVSSYGYIIYPDGVTKSSPYQKQIKIGNSIETIHFIIANTFIKNMEQGDVIVHIDGNKSNKNVNNLQIWNKNKLHSYLLLSNNENKRLPNSPSISDGIKQLIKQTKVKVNISNRQLAKLLNVSDVSIGKVLKN